MSHGFYGCDFIPIHGNIFKVGPSGGGDVSIFGGSAVMRPAKGDVAAVHYLITIPDAAHVGPQNGQFSFFGFRLESHADAHSRLVNLASTKMALYESHFMVVISRRAQAEFARL